MSREPLNAAIKTRVPSAVKEAYERLATERHVDAADLQREALRDYLQRQTQPVTESQPQPQEVAA